MHAGAGAEHFDGLSDDALLAALQESATAPVAADGSVRALSDAVAARLHTLVQLEAWRELMIREDDDEVPRMVEYTCSLLVEYVTTEELAWRYEQLVGDVLLNEFGALPHGRTLQHIEKAREHLLRRLAKCWVQVRAAAGFDCLSRWCIKELAHELDVDVHALRLQPMPGMPVRARIASSGDSTHAHTSAGLSTSAYHACGDTLACVREPGPISLRAAVMNRHAAQASYS